MDAALEAKLARLKNYRTRYEIVLRHDDGRTLLVCYSDSRSRVTMHRVIGKYGADIVKVLGLPDDARYQRAGSLAAQGYSLPGGWTLIPSGRTQREAYIQGTHEFIRSAARAMTPAV